MGGVEGASKAMVDERLCGESWLEEQPHGCAMKCSNEYSEVCGSYCL